MFNFLISIINFSLLLNKGYFLDPLYVYEGCYIDKEDRDLTYSKSSSQKMTKEYCLNICSNNEQRFAGLQFAYIRLKYKHINH